jgi:hypothetical protein
MLVTEAPRHKAKTGSPGNDPQGLPLIRKAAFQPPE